jgi:hypothetical protein
MAVRSCWIFVGTGTLLYMSIKSTPNMLNGGHVWWVCRPWKNFDIFSFQEFSFQENFQLPGMYRSLGNGSVDISIYPVQLKPGLIREVPLLQRASGHRRWAFAHWSQLRHQTAVSSRPWWAHRWASLRQFVQTFFRCANPQLRQLSGWLVSDDSIGEEARCGGPGLAWFDVVWGFQTGWTYCQII